VFGIGSTELVLLTFVVIVVGASAYGWHALYRSRPIGPLLLMAVLALLCGVFPARTDWQSALWLAAVLRLTGLTGVVIGLAKLVRGTPTSKSLECVSGNVVARQTLGISSKGDRREDESVK
jgi:hypothetical protein